MAKQPVNQEPAEVVIFYARARGGGAAVAASVQALANAVERTTQPPRIAARPVKSLPGTSTTNGQSAERTLFDDVEESAEQQIDMPENDGVDEAAPLGGVEDKKPPRKLPVYTFVKDLNLRPDGKKSMKDFHTEKSPADKQAQFTVIVYYLSQILGIANVGINHIYTAMKEVGAKVPNDIAQTARNISKRKGWLDSADSANLTVTTNGQNFVEHDLPGVAT